MSQLSSSRPIFRLKLLISLMFFLLPTGCLNMEEPENMFYIYAVGVDYDEKKGEYILYGQALNFQSIAKTGSIGGSGGEKGNVQLWVGVGRGITMDGAIQSMMITSQRRLYWGHLNAIILTENLMRHGVHDVFDLTARFNEPKYTVWLFATADSPLKILSSMPILNESPVKSIIGDPHQLYETISVVPPVRLHRLTAYMNEPGGMPSLIHLTTTSSYWRENRKKQLNLYVDGASFIRKGKFVSTLKTKEILGLRWMIKEVKRPRISLLKGDRPVATLLPFNIRPQVKVVGQGNHPAFDVEIRLKATLLQLSRPLSTDRLEKMAEELVKKEVQETYRNAVAKKVDPYGLLHHLYHQDPKRWRKILSSRSFFPLKNDSLRRITVKVEILSTGKVK
ncbi:putative spore germination protein [[Clostridium] ultunense Esp]|nr:putative spore germination protein [[Clostridium] ultunense Esp]